MTSLRHIWQNTVSNLPMAEAFCQDFGSSEDGTEAAQRHLLGGSLGQFVELRDRKVQAKGDLFEECPGASRALPIHLEAGAASLVVQMNHLAVLGPDIDDRHRL